MLGWPLIDGPRATTCERIDRNGAQGFVASHDGYVARFGLFHERELVLSRQGNLLEGCDRVFRAGGEAARDNGRDHATLRFHVHPDVNVARDEDGRLLLSAAGGDVWAFSADRVEPAVEESIFFAGLIGPRRSRQIVIAWRASEQPEVRWRLERVAATAPARG
jgi:uncharacterized heparinase superfamily protein